MPEKNEKRKQSPRLFSVDDPFSVETNAYSADKFYTKSTDDKGHSVNVQVPVPTGINARIQELINSGEWPWYRSVQDFARDAMYHRLRYLNEGGVDRQMERLLDTWGHRARMAMRKIEMDGLHKIIEETRGTLESAKTAEDWDMMAAVLDESREVVEEIREPYKSQLSSIIKEYDVIIDKKQPREGK